MILYINGSPRINSSNSQYFINLINSNSLVKYIYKDNFEEITKELLKSDTIIFSFPLYVDSPPNKILEYMEYIRDNKIELENKKIYIICNCGFLEAKQNIIAAEIFKNFCNKNKAVYSGSFLIGAGEVIGNCKNKFIYKLVCFDFFKKIKLFKQKIHDNKYVDLLTTINPMTKKLYVYLANIGWKKSIKKCKNM